MNFFSTLSLSALLLSSPALVMANSNLQNGEKIFRQCAMCHGKSAENSAFNESRIIRNLKETEIVTALKDRKAGKVIGGGNGVKARLSEQDMRDVAAFIQTLK
ncbi:c-type cytochrome [Conservatibacter flavescens]|uniref:Cytochrome C biogenesis protein CcsB n=1 Tax=Conservatibacter flavescens TaxID=28161 RepID=A0A2M8S5K2_9PAST|nr:c-type cytochrome [Conservatibacter flavescens]PJG86442.1 cytochrome C biogenesis protein CcsB [Conservatibacter flavescens]